MLPAVYYAGIFGAHSLVLLYSTLHVSVYVPPEPWDGKMVISKYGAKHMNMYVIYDTL